ncbi:hypothetical protein ABZ027_32685 [Streptomyces sp. NPDC006332]|uniref:hypothetical protein n=1 Tax=Streptomyces sp. NPDC006332 TaxID=3155456 RepID=UPI0033B45CDA
MRNGAHPDRVLTDIVDDFPSGVAGVIRHAVALNLRHHGQQLGTDNLRWSDGRVRDSSRPAGGTGM